MKNFILKKVMAFFSLAKSFSSSGAFKIIFYLSLFLMIFSFSFVLPRDPDLGWHLRYGEGIINNKQVLTQDTFSHSFLGKSVVDTEWLTDAGSYLLYQDWSFAGLSIVFGIVTTLAFFIPLIFIKSDLYHKFLFGLWASFGSVFIISAGARAQNMSWLLFSILILLLFKYQENLKLRYLVFCPPLFLLWANIHPGFFLGLLTFSIFIFSDMIGYFIYPVRKRISIAALFIREKFIFLFFILSLIATNFRPKTDIIDQGGFLNYILPLDLIKALLLPGNLAVLSSRGVVRTSIIEWLPPNFLNLSGVIFFLALVFSVGIFMFQKIKRDDFRNLVLILFFVYFSTLSARNIPFFFLVFIPAAIKEGKEIIDGKKIRYYIPYLNMAAILIMFCIAGKNFYSNSGDLLKVRSSIQEYCDETINSCQAIDFIKNTKPKGELFNHYNFGGFLIWQLPEYPVFIDGRVPGEDIFYEYQTVIGLKEGWQNILNKYNIKLVLFTRDETFESTLKKDNWREAYADEEAVVLVRD